MSERRLPVVFVLGVAALLFVGGVGWAVLSALSRSAPAAGSPLRTSSGPLPFLGPVPAFALVSSDGLSFGRDDLDGRPWLANFIFTTCGSVCPRMSSQMARLQRELPEVSPLRLVSITVDPGHDTPEVLREYAERYGARPERWIFLTGEPEAVYRLSAEGFHLAAGERPEGELEAADGPFFHSTRMALVDAGGHVRGYYDGTDLEEMQRLRADLERLDEPGS